MKTLVRRLKRLFTEMSPLTLAILASIATFAMVFPEVLFFMNSPMYPAMWELNDPAVSAMNFVPGITTLRAEVFNHHQLLWTGLRNLGTPILANDVQVAPLFPLTLALLWIPDPYYWNVFITTRVILLGTGAFLISSNIFGFKRLPSFVFMTSFVFSPYLIMKINHPYQTGVMVSLWYFYIMARSLQQLGSQMGNIKRSQRNLLLGQTLAVYSMITCGFPEGAAVGAVITAVTFIPLFICAASTHRRSMTQFVCIALVSHILGFALASSQIFSLVEYLRQTSPTFRSGHGLAQFESYSVIWPWFFRLSDSLPSGVVIHFFGAIISWLWILGIVSSASSPKSLSRYDIGAILAGIFYFLKCFKIWPDFNRFVGSLPVLDQSWFTAYFFPLLLWCSSYCAAKGFTRILDQKQSERKSLGRLIIASLLVLLTLLYGAIHFSPEVHLISILRTFVPLTLIIVMTLVPQPHHWNKYKFSLSLACCFIILIEANYALPGKFVPFDSSQFLLQSPHVETSGNQIPNLVKNSGLKFPNVRERSGNGDFVQYGLATFDNGAPAIISERNQLLRLNLFHAPANGYLPIEGAKFPGAWQVCSSGLTAIPNKDVAQYLVTHRNDGTQYKILGNDPFLSLLIDEKTPNRAYQASSCILSSSPHESAQIIRSPTLFQTGTVALENLTPQELEFCQKYAKPLLNLTIEQDQGSQITLEEIQGPTIMVLNDSFYPGWSAWDKISNSEIKIKPANINFKAAILPENRLYKLQFTYRPTWLIWSYYLTCGAMIGLLGISILLSQTAGPRKIH